MTSIAPSIARQLSHTLGMPVIPQVRVNPNILGGIIVRVEDRVMDGSLRRRLGTPAWADVGESDRVGRARERLKRVRIGRF